MTHPALARNFRFRRSAIMTGTCAAHGRAVNDNALFDTPADALRNDHVQAALRLLARYGLQAAALAFDHARAARTAGDEKGSDRWLQIGRILDRRLADELRRTVGADRAR